MKIVARNSSPGRVKFCLWSQEAGAQFFPAIQSTDKQGQYCHEIKASHEGINLSQINGPIALLAFRSGDQEVRSPLKIQQKLEHRLSRLCAKIVQGDSEDFNKVAPTSIQNDSAFQHFQISAELQAFCGVLINGGTEQDNCVQYEIELYMDEQRSTVKRMETD